MHPVAHNVMQRSVCLTYIFFATQGNLKELLPFPAASFDQIISTGVFQPGHVGPEVIPNILSLLKPRGFFITTVRLPCLLLSLQA